MGLATSWAPNALPKKRGWGVNGTPSSTGPQRSAEGEGGSEPPFLSDPQAARRKGGRAHMDHHPSPPKEKGRGGRVPGTRVPPPLESLTAREGERHGESHALLLAPQRTGRDRGSGNGGDQHLPAPRRC